VLISRHRVNLKKFSIFINHQEKSILLLSVELDYSNRIKFSINLVLVCDLECMIQIASRSGFFKKNRYLNAIQIFLYRSVYLNPD